MQNWNWNEKNSAFHSFCSVFFTPLSTFDFLCSRHWMQWNLYFVCLDCNLFLYIGYYCCSCFFFRSYFLFWKNVHFRFFFFCPLSTFFSLIHFTEFGNPWIGTGCTSDPIIVWAVIILIDTMLWSKTTDRTFYNEFESDIVGGDGSLLCSHWSRQVFFSPFLFST